MTAEGVEARMNCFYFYVGAALGLWACVLWFAQNQSGEEPPGSLKSFILFFLFEALSLIAIFPLGAFC